MTVWLKLNDTRVKVDSEQDTCHVAWCLTNLFDADTAELNRQIEEEEQ